MGWPWPCLEGVFKNNVYKKKENGVRWVCYGLLIINLLYFIGQLLLGALSDGTERPGLALDKNAETVRLVREVPDRVVRQEQAALALLDQVETQVAAAVPDYKEGVCDYWGPFLSELEAYELLQALPDSVKGYIKEETKTLPSRYWAYLPARESRADALLLVRDLARQGVKAHLIGEGALANGLSLGLYDDRAQIEALRDRLRASGLAPVVEAKNTETVWYWVQSTPSFDPSPDPNPESAPEISRQMAKKFPGIKAQQKVCDTVASPP